MIRYCTYDEEDFCDPVNCIIVHLDAVQLLLICLPTRKTRRQQNPVYFWSFFAPPITYRCKFCCLQMVFERERGWPLLTALPSIPSCRTLTNVQSVAKVASITEVFPVELQPTAPPPQNKRGDSSLRSVAGNTRRSLQRFYARVQAKRALARTASSSPPGLSARNPLMLIGVGALLSPRDCDIIVDEAQSGQGEWVSWDGDAGEGSTATSLHDLPESRALWEGKAGDTVCARIANVYGVQNSSVVVDTRDVFVCRVAGGGCEGANKLDWGRRMAWGTSGTVDAQQRQQQQQCLVAAEFRRSSSLITFFVELSAGETKTASWAACLEQRRQCFRLCGQGAGVILSGKLRHATVPVLSPDRAGERPGRDEQTNPSVVLLRGFASIRHRCIREDFALWRWGCPAWHVDAPWVKDEGILNRVWVARESDGGADEAGESPPAITTAAEGGGATMVSAVAASGGHYLERMNSSLAHRYYKQGLAGIDVPVLDDKGRPVIDLLLIEDRPLLLRVLGSPRTPETTVTAELRRRFPWSRARRRLGKAGLSTEAGISPRMDAALQELFGASLAEGERFDRVPVPPIKYVFVDPRYRGLGLGRRLFLEAMCVLARKGFRFALIVVEDNGSGGLFGFYEEMGFVGAEEQLGLPRAMIAPIPPPDSILASAQRI